MSELSTKTIPEMQMDFAMLVVHAHESVLYINNDNLELGYAKVYRALMEAAGGNVIVVIGGDDHYKDETEEEQSVISRWAWRKIAHSQFKEEFIDGRKERLKMTQPGSATETEGKPVDGKPGQPLRSPMQKEQSVTDTHTVALYT